MPIPPHHSCAENNAGLMVQCVGDARKQPHPTIAGKTAWQGFEEEMPFLATM